MKSAPPWVKIAVYGAVLAVSLDYFLKPTMNKTLGLQVIAMSLLGLPTIIPNPWPTKGPTQKVDDIAVKDNRKHLSTILSDAGFSGQSLADAKGVALAESGGNPKVINKAGCGKNWDGTKAVAVGLLQMCTVHAGEYGIPKDINKAIAWLQDPENNAHAGKALFDAAGGTFARDWVTFQTGAYKRYHSDPIITVDKNSLTSEVKDATQPIRDAAGLISALFDPSTYLRLGKGLLGGILIVLGVAAFVYMMANAATNGGAGRTLKKAAVTAAVL